MCEIAAQEQNETAQAKPEFEHPGREEGPDDADGDAGG